LGGNGETGFRESSDGEVRAEQAAPCDSLETLRRVACDCALLALGHHGQALNIGRRARSIPPAIRRALMLRDG
jgi:hypothetical protein